MEGIRAGPHQDPHDRVNNDVKPERSGAGAPPPLTLSPKQGVEALLDSAVNRHSQRMDVLFLKAVWGGIFLSYGGFFEAVVAGSPSVMNNNPGLLRLVEGLVFPVGLTMIVLSGTDLLTSDMMIIFLGAIEGRVPWWGVIYNYVIVFLGNLAGSLFFAAILVRYTDLADGTANVAIHDFLTNTAHTRAVTTEWHALFLRGIGCNIMVNMSVYLAGQASDLVSKVVAIWIPLSTFVVLQYEHVVADMFTIPMGMMLGADVSAGQYIGRAMVAAFIGNWVGGALLGLSLYWFYLHDTHAPLIGRKAWKDNEANYLNGHAERKGGEGGGPLGQGTFGEPYKVQHVLGLNRGYHHNDGR